MIRGRLLFALCCILAVTGSIRALKCFTDHWQHINCNSNGSSPAYNHCVVYNKIGKNFSCPLVLMNHTYHCSCRVKEGEGTVSSADEFNISICNESGCHGNQVFEAWKNIQLSPPEFDMNQTGESVNITWKTERFKGDYLKDKFKFEFNLRDSQGHERSLFFFKKSNRLFINGSQLKPNTEYCIKARCSPDYPYEGILSEWSDPKCWINIAGGEEQEGITHLLARYMIPIFLSAAVLVFVFYNPKLRMKIKTIAHTSSPAPFFQPMFQQHEGNLQEWFSPKGKFVLTYKEDLITSDVSVVPKPTTKEPEEHQGFSNPPVTHLVFPQSVTSYVGLPRMHEAPPTLVAVRAEDTPYTQLPCPVWGFDLSEIQTTPPLDDFLDISKADSGCSCEDLSLSPECSVPCSPGGEGPSPHFCNDYCILNKTAVGVVPVLVSKQVGGKILSDTQEADG